MSRRNFPVWVLILLLFAQCRTSMHIVADKSYGGVWSAGERHTIMTPDTFGGHHNSFPKQNAKINKVSPSQILISKNYLFQKTSKKYVKLEPKLQDKIIKKNSIKSVKGTPRSQGINLLILTFFGLALMVLAIFTTFGNGAFIFGVFGFLLICFAYGFARRRYAEAEKNGNNTGVLKAARTISAILVYATLAALVIGLIGVMFF